MCQILDIKAGATVPMEMLELTCDINRHGFGVAWLDNGNIKIERSISVNNAKTLGGLLDRIKDKRRFVHIRHATIGEVSMANNHPFVVLEQKKHRQKKRPALIMMHNGTLWGYDEEKAKGISDTYLFNQRFVRPLALRCEAFGGLKSVLRDELFRKLIIDETKSSDKILMVDNLGYVLTFNRNSGKDFPEFGFWASNTYSFDKNHNRSSSISTSGGFGEFDRRWNQSRNVAPFRRDTGTDSILSNLPWKETEAQKAEREAWMVEMEASSTNSADSTSVLIPNSVFIDRMNMRKECAAAGAFISKRHIERKTRRL
jgi:predicted glutamine amidotransferase